jgi:hypothetical protein
MKTTSYPSTTHRLAIGALMGVWASDFVVADPVSRY